MLSAKAGIIPRLLHSSAFSTTPGDLLNEPSPASAPLENVRPSACPGLLRVVMALDGGICRIKLPGGVLNADQADAVALAAERFAGGVIEATNRGNVQIRGIGGQSLELIKYLLAAGLGPREAAADDVRNVMLSPTAGIDPQMQADTRLLAAQILDSLESTPSFHQLSAKFAVQLDGGEGLAMLEHHHDVWLSPLAFAGQSWWAFGLAGSPLDGTVMAVRQAHGHAVVLALLQAFLATATPAQHRMRDLLAAQPSWPPARGVLAGIDVQPVNFKRTPGTGRALGAHAQLQAATCYVGAAAPLGRLTPAMLRGVAQAARTWGDGTLRMTPWQGLLLPNVAVHLADQALQALQSTGLLTDAGQPLAQLIACTGSSGCAKAHADTKHDAMRLAQRLPRARALHLSGCSRSCAAAHTAPVTLLAVSAGHYDVYFCDADQPGFGALQARDLSLDAIATLLGEGSRSDTHD